MRIHAILFSMILCKRVTKKIDGKAVLSDVTLRIEPKECVCIVGEARAGKTTLFELLLKAQEPTSGSIEVDGVPLTTLPPLILQLYRSRLGVIFQEPRLLLHSTVAENIAFPLEIRGAAQSLIDRRVAELLKRFTLTTLKDQLPGDLSLSERALVGIARAFVASPLILMADEPLQALDEAQAQAVLELFLEAKRQGCTIVVFTSNPSLADAIGARVLTLSGGKIIEQPKGHDLGRAPVRHRILETDEEPALTSVTVTEEPMARLVKDKRKVKITQIHS